MARHILDHAHQVRPEAPVTRYAKAARSLAEGPAHPKEIALRRRAKGSFNPAARLRAYLRIERGLRV